MFNLFKKKSSFENPLKVDFHSHLLPDLDDGVNSFEESIEILKRFRENGYQKVITTPHIMKEFYDNDKNTIEPQFLKLKDEVKNAGLEIELGYAAEYHIDEFFIEKLDQKEKLLTFGDNYILVETSFYNAPVFLKDVLFKLAAQGYKPVFAHPERYAYLQQNNQLLEDIFHMQVYFQINIPSLAGYYSKPIKKFAEKLIENGYVHFLGSDCHNNFHFDALEKALGSKNFQTLPFQKILNNTLLDV